MTDPKPNPASPCCPPANGCASAPTGGAYVSTPSEPIYEARGMDPQDLVLIEPNHEDGHVHARVGSEDDDIWPADGEAPIREVRVDPFYISPTSVTNAQFESFVQATGYKTEAERFGWSYVFLVLLPKSRQRKLKGSRTVQGLDWWFAIEGATWRKPEGPGSNLKKRTDYPVVHVTWNDAIAYCHWAGCRLPTEAEWEIAARGGLEGKRFPWGDELHPNGKHRCNIWQGDFPARNTAEDGYVGTAPAKSFPANAYGLYNCSGNVWEWCVDWFDPHWRAAQKDLHNPRGPADPPAGPEPRKIMKGGSFLCHHSYCNRYRVGARTGNTPDSSTANCGFRVVRDK